MSGEDLVAPALEGDRRALARLLSRLERGGEDAGRLLAQLYPHAGAAHVVGVTGAPGTGKSTLVSRLARELRQRDQRVAVVAVDPSSPFSGGALLGDRVRMGDLHGDPGVFVRSMAARSAGGGLAEQTGAAIVALDAAGFAVVLVETVGVGQGELEVAGEAHTTVVVTAPGLGDDVQALKAGILEIADVLVVNKADRDGAERLVAELTFARSAGGTAAWTAPVLKTVATGGEGVPALLAALDAHREWLERSGGADARTRALAERHILRWAASGVVRHLRQRARASGALADLVDAVASRRLSPPAAASRLLRESLTEALGEADSE